MGKKRPSIRTLPTGEKVVHSPDDTLRLVPQNRMLNMLVSAAEQTAAAEDQTAARLLAAVDDKRAALDAGDAVPNEKRPI